MAKINDIRFLAQETAKEVSGSPRDWMRYLDTASRLYRYSFSDTLLIHAQRPDAVRGLKVCPKKNNGTAWMPCPDTASSPVGNH